VRRGHATRTDDHGAVRGQGSRRVTVSSLSIERSKGSLSAIGFGCHSSEGMGHQLRSSRATRCRTRLNGYTAYSVGCAAVWAAILVLSGRRTDSRTRDKLRLLCVGWWSGWTSATIARSSYPPPKELESKAAERLAIVSLALVAVGVISVIRVLITGRRRGCNP
jgi:hypothetical protein